MDLPELEWKIWKPLQAFNAGAPVVLMVLNQPIKEEVKIILKQHWQTAVLRIAVDGGLLHFHEINETEMNYIPDIICGDFDSLTPEMLDRYAKMGSEIIHTPDQNETDFTKALRICIERLSSRDVKVEAILVVARNGDRLDHVLGNLNTLYTAVELSPTPTYLLGDNTLSWLLTPGKHKIVISEKLIASRVGLIPLGEPCLNVTTTGLKWNLSHGKMEFGGLVSTCNRFDRFDFVTVESDRHLIWTMELNLDSKKE